MCGILCYNSDMGDIRHQVLAIWKDKAVVKGTLSKKDPEWPPIPRRRRGSPGRFSNPTMALGGRLTGSEEETRPRAALTSEQDSDHIRFKAAQCAHCTVQEPDFQTLRNGFNPKRYICDI